MDQGFSAEGHDLIIGLDVGSTTVKAVVIDPRTHQTLWSDYQFHETRQPEKALELLKAIEARFPAAKFHAFITGSGGEVLAEYIGARFVQEVNAVAAAVEQLHPDVGSVIELGGQDAKIIIWIEDATTGRKKKMASMNDKCAGGTGAVIERISSKLNIPTRQVQQLRYSGNTIHPVAGKCGVFAETDINSLQKQGVPPQELMASLLDALVQQNLSVLTRGNTLRPKVLLLGGPHAFIPALREAWQANIPRIWQERGVALPAGVLPEDLIVVPENAQYYAALGSALYGLQEGSSAPYEGTAALEEYIEEGRRQLREATGASGLFQSLAELEEFRKEYVIPPFEPPRFSPGQVVEVYIGLDAGSTSTKGVLVDADSQLLAKAYQLSKGDPILDAKEILGSLRQQMEAQGVRLVVKGLGVTGYAKDLLAQAFHADVAIVETVAHSRAALHYYDDVDVIADVGGQDIKVIFLKKGTVKDFKLNTQCSAGNGYFLQSAAGRFGYGVTQYADIAFQAQRAPAFHYGCAVFLEQDIAHFQQLGWSPQEIMAGLAQVLPKNVWLYVVQQPNLGKFGRTFLLQGGTNYNLAVVKAQHDYIKSKVPDARVIVHRHAGESGAIGAALEAIRVVGEGESSFIGFQRAENLVYRAAKDESTRCDFCKNQCLRTFVDVQGELGDDSWRRFIIATCEKGTVEEMSDMRAIQARVDAVQKANPDLVDLAATWAFRSYRPPIVAENGHSKGGLLTGLLGRAQHQQRIEKYHLRESIRIGIPRVLSMYYYAPFFRSYLESLGVKPQNIVWSDVTDDKMYREGSRRGSIDPCFPGKLAIAHVHNLIYRKNVNVIFFPILMNLTTELANVQDSWACPTVQGMPDVVRASFTTDRDSFGERGIRYCAPVLHLGEPNLLEKQMGQFFGELLGVTPAENRQAIEQGHKAMGIYITGLRRRGRAVLDQLEREGRVGVVCLGRPYHNDPGVNHEILTEIQKRGYPIFSIESLPTEEDILERLFGEEVSRGAIKSALSIEDVWKHSFSENTNRKVWAAKYVARHPNLAAVDFSSFKCGMDSPIYHVIEGILEATDTPYFTFHEMDENRAAGSIKLRVETIDYFLKRYQEELRQRQETEQEIEKLAASYRENLSRQQSIAR